MRQSALSQRRRLIVLLIEVAVLCLASSIVFGRPLPPNGDKGFWFYTGLLGLVLGSRLDTPFFAKPADVILYAAPAAVALALSNNWAGWDSGRRVAFVIALVYFGLVALIGGIAIWTKDATEESLRRISNAARVLGETLGAPRPIYTVLMIFALYAFHSDSALELGILALAWAVTAALSPLEATIKLSDKVSQILRGGSPAGEVGVVAAYQTPGVILERHAIFFGRASQCENPVLMRANDRAAFVQVFRAAHPPAVPGNNAAAPIV